MLKDCSKGFYIFVIIDQNQTCVCPFLTVIQLPHVVCATQTQTDCLLWKMQLCKKVPNYIGDLYIGNTEREGERERGIPGIEQGY